MLNTLKTQISLLHKQHRILRFKRVLFATHIKYHCLNLKRLNRTPELPHFASFKFTVIFYHQLKEVPAPKTHKSIALFSAGTGAYIRVPMCLQ